MTIRTSIVNRESVPFKDTRNVSQIQIYFHEDSFSIYLFMPKNSGYITRLFLSYMYNTGFSLLQHTKCKTMHINKVILYVFHRNYISIYRNISCKMKYEIVENFTLRRYIFFLNNERQVLSVAKFVQRSQHYYVIIRLN